jgi:hypothetical protein
MGGCMSTETVYDPNTARKVTVTNLKNNKICMVEYLEDGVTKHKETVYDRKDMNPVSNICYNDDGITVACIGEYFPTGMLKKHTGYYDGTNKVTEINYTRNGSVITTNAIAYNPNGSIIVNKVYDEYVSPDEIIVKFRELFGIADPNIQNMPPINNTKDAVMCTACTIVKPNYIILPCGHPHMCSECHKKWLINQNNKKCPTCKQDIEKYVVTYL